MIYETGTRRLLSVYEALHGKGNDVVICREAGTDIISYTTVWVIKDHTLAKAVLQCFYEGKRKAGQPYLESFSSGSDFCLTFPYYPERPLMHFYTGAIPIKKRRSIRLELIEVCLTCGLPFPILYLMLSQEQMNLETDNRIRFQYLVDLEGFDLDIGESECAAVCAELLLRLFEEEEGKEVIGYDLLHIKLQKERYMTFIDLYKDIKLVSYDKSRKNWFNILKESANRYKDRIFRMMLAAGIGLAAVAVFLLVSQLIFGEIPLLRLFSDSFHVIGTENLRLR